MSTRNIAGSLSNKWRLLEDDGYFAEHGIPDRIRLLIEGLCYRFRMRSFACVFDVVRRGTNYLVH